MRKLPIKRKAMNYKNIIAVSLILFIFHSVSAQDDTEIRNYTKTIPVGKETTLEISNKYGTIQITPWNKDSACIRAEVKAYAKDHSKLGKMFDGITVNITDSKYIVRASTEFTSNINTLFESFKGMTSKIISYDSHIEINYYINIPDYLNLNINNKYGDVYMENNTGEFRISLSNGSFKANSIGKGSSITLVFCNARINSVLSGNLNASFSELAVGQAGEITLNSISSKYNIKKAGTLKGESRRDKFFIEDIESLTGNAYFTDYTINNLSRELNLTTRYGSINTDFISREFESIIINSGYSDISLRFEPGSSYNFDISHVNSFLVLPDKNVKTEERFINRDKKELMTEGTVGRNPGSSRVRIEATRGNIYLK